MSYDIVKYTGRTTAGRVLYDLTWADVVLDGWATTSPDLNSIKRLPPPTVGLPSWGYRKKARVPASSTDSDSTYVDISVYLIPSKYEKHLLFKFEYSDGFNVGVTHPEIYLPSSRVESSENFSDFVTKSVKDVLLLGFLEYPQNTKMLTAVAEAVRLVTTDFSHWDSINHNPINVGNLITMLGNGFDTQQKVDLFQTPNMKVSAYNIQYATSSGFTLVHDFEWVYFCCPALQSGEIFWDKTLEWKNAGLTFEVFSQTLKKLQEKTYDKKKILVDLAWFFDHQWKPFVDGDLSKASLFITAGYSPKEAKYILNTGEPVDWDALRIHGYLRQGMSEPVGVLV